MRNSHYGVSYINYPDTNRLGQGSTSYLSSSQYLQKTNHSDNKYLNPADIKRYDQYPYTSSQYSSPGDYGASQSNYTSVQTGAFPNIPSKEEERFEVDDSSQAQQTNITQVFQTPLMAQEENMRHNEGYTGEKKKRAGQQTTPFDVKEEGREEIIENNTGNYLFYELE